MLRQQRQAKMMLGGTCVWVTPAQLPRFQEVGYTVVDYSDDSRKILIRVSPDALMPVITLDVTGNYCHPKFITFDIQLGGDNLFGEGRYHRNYDTLLGTREMLFDSLTYIHHNTSFMPVISIGGHEIAGVFNIHDYLPVLDMCPYTATVSVVVDVANYVAISLDPTISISQLVKVSLDNLKALI
jgi:hypothetical protein